MKQFLPLHALIFVEKWFPHGQHQASMTSGNVVADVVGWWQNLKLDSHWQTIYFREVGSLLSHRGLIPFLLLVVGVGMCTSQFWPMRCERISARRRASLKAFSTLQERKKEERCCEQLMFAAVLGSCVNTPGKEWALRIAGQRDRRHLGPWDHHGAAWFTDQGGALFFLYFEIINLLLLKSVSVTCSWKHPKLDSIEKEGNFLVLN